MHALKLAVALSTSWPGGVPPPLLGQVSEGVISLRYSIEGFAFRTQDGAQGIRTRHGHKTHTRGGTHEQQSDPLVTPNRSPGQLKLTSRSLQIHPLVGPNWLPRSARNDPQLSPK